MYGGSFTRAVANLQHGSIDLWHASARSNSDRRALRLLRGAAGECAVWEVPGTGIFTVATFQVLAEAAGRVEEFSSNLNCLLYRDENGMPCRLSFGDAGVQALATADPPTHALHRDTVFPELLVAKRMAALEPDIVEIAEECVAQALCEGSVDFMASIGNVVPITMISRLIGFHDSDLDQLLNAAFGSTAMFGIDVVLRRVGGTHRPHRGNRGVGIWSALKRHERSVAGPTWGSRPRSKWPLAVRG